MDDSIDMKARFKAVRNEARETRASLYHLTNQCNLRCTSGARTKCRDSQAVMSWLLVNARHVSQEDDGLRTWTEVAESYFSQFVWSRYHPRNRAGQTLDCAVQ